MVADVWLVKELNRVVGTLQRAADDPRTRGPLVGVVRGDGTLDLRIPPTEVMRSPGSFLCMIGAGIREAEASAVGVVLPVRTVWGEDRVCDYLDAEALVLVAVEDVGDGVGSVGMRCALHALPAGWEEAHESLRWIASPLRQAVAGRPIEEDEAL
jgi:hypothetical protein